MFPRAVLGSRHHTWSAQQDRISRLRTVATLDAEQTLKAGNSAGASAVLAWSLCGFRPTVRMNADPRACQHRAEMLRASRQMARQWARSWQRTQIGGWLGHRQNLGGFYTGAPAGSGEDPGMQLSTANTGCIPTARCGFSVLGLCPKRSAASQQLAARSHMIMKRYPSSRTRRRLHGSCVFPRP